jgi:hypothetical protein
MTATTAKAMIFSIPRICSRVRPFSSPEICHNQTYPAGRMVAEKRVTYGGLPKGLRNGPSLGWKLGPKFRSAGRGDRHSCDVGSQSADTIKLILQSVHTPAMKLPFLAKVFD